MKLRSRQGHVLKRDKYIFVEIQKTRAAGRPKEISGAREGAGTLTGAPTIGFLRWREISGAGLPPSEGSLAGEPTMQRKTSVRILQPHALATRQLDLQIWTAICLEYSLARYRRLARHRGVPLQRRVPHGGR